jgi:DNA-binding IclR family transcriptional regulator
MYSFHGKRGQREEVLDTLIRKSSITKSELAKLCGAKVNVYRLLPKLKTEGSIVEDSEERLSISSQLLRVAILFAGYQRTVDASD